jgi:hypothetical protein
MALHQFDQPDLYDLRNHEALLDDFFDFLQDSLGQHTYGYEYVRNDRTMEPHYHARVNVLTQGPQRGRPLIEWSCPHCRQIYTYARYFNHQRNQVRLECHNRDPDYAPNRSGEDKTMIDPLRPPFSPISPEVLARVLRTLALSQPIPLIPTTPSPPMPGSPSEEVGTQDAQPDLPLNHASPPPVTPQPGEVTINGDPNGIIHQFPTTTSGMNANQASHSNHLDE